MVRSTRRSVVEWLGIGMASGFAGCTTGSESPSNGSTANESAADGATSRAETSGTDSPERTVRLLFTGVDEGNLEAIRRLSIGFEDLGEWSPDATLFLPEDGDPLTTELIQGDATADDAYRNFAPDGEYLEVENVAVETTEESDEGMEVMQPMSGPEVERVVVAEPSVEYRINLEGTWYDATTTSQVIAAKVDERWYASTGVTPWYVVTRFLPDEYGVRPEEKAKIRGTVTLPLGPE